MGLHFDLNTELPPTRDFLRDYRHQAAVFERTLRERKIKLDRILTALLTLAAITLAGITDLHSAVIFTAITVSSFMLASSLTHYLNTRIIIFVSGLATAVTVIMWGNYSGAMEATAILARLVAVAISAGFLAAVIYETIIHKRLRNAAITFRNLTELSAEEFPHECIRLDNWRNKHPVIDRYLCALANLGRAPTVGEYFAAASLVKADRTPPEGNNRVTLHERATTAYQRFLSVSGQYD